MRFSNQCILVLLHFNVLFVEVSHHWLFKILSYRRYILLLSCHYYLRVCVWKEIHFDGCVEVTLLWTHHCAQYSDTLLWTHHCTQYSDTLLWTHHCTQYSDTLLWTHHCAHYMTTFHWLNRTSTLTSTNVRSDVLMVVTMKVILQDCYGAVQQTHNDVLKEPAATPPQATLNINGTVFQ
jgi:hypothetical protein